MSRTVTAVTTAAATMVAVDERAVRSAHQAAMGHETPASAAMAAWRTSAAPASSRVTMPATTATKRASGVTAGTSPAA